MVVFLETLLEINTIKKPKNLKTNLGTWYAIEKFWKIVGCFLLLEKSWKNQSQCKNFINMVVTVTIKNFKTLKVTPKYGMTINFFRK